MKKSWELLKNKVLVRILLEFEVRLAVTENGSTKIVITIITLIFVKKSSKMTFYSKTKCFVFAPMRPV